MAATKRTKKQSAALRGAIQRATTHGKGEVWAANEERLVVWFPDEERAYLYAVPTEEEGRKLHWVAGRAILAIDRRDSDDAEFKAACERLV